MLAGFPMIQDRWALFLTVILTIPLLLPCWPGVRNFKVFCGRLSLRDFNVHDQQGEEGWFTTPFVKIPLFTPAFTTGLLRLGEPRCSMYHQRGESFFFFRPRQPHNYTTAYSNNHIIIFFIIISFFFVVVVVDVCCNKNSIHKIVYLLLLMKNI